jgi:hypothetical protein
MLLAYQAPLIAQSFGVSSQGVTGGLVIPSAEVLAPGSLAFTFGNFQEPQFGAAHASQNNLSFGIGLAPRLEFFGRFADYTNPSPTSPIFASGVRDLSANFKLQLPTPWDAGPKVAMGVNDLSGGAVFFKSGYLVTSDHYGPLGVTLGYAKGSAARVGAKPTFDGAFGGLDFRIFDTGLAVLAEYDGQQKHAGLRWHSEPIDLLSRARVVANVQKTFGALTPAGLDANASSFALSLVVPLGENEQRAEDFKPASYQALPPLDAQASADGFQPTAEDRMASLQKALVAAGLERVRLGLLDGLFGQLLIIEYENHRYAHNEADALGIVLGLASEMAPAGTQRVHAVTFKGGLKIYETSVGVGVYRTFLRDGSAQQVRGSLSWDRLPADPSAPIRWLDPKPTAASLIHIEIKPDLNYTLGTEVGAFDYALAANVQVMAPLWAGGRLYTSTLIPMANSSNMDPGAVFDVSLQRSGLKTAALQQSFWMGTHVLSQVSVGRFYYDTWGVQGESTAFVPGSDDTIHVRGAAYRDAPGGLAGNDRAFAASYRHMLAPAMSVEAGVQRYSDGSSGPSVAWTRWFGDTSAQLFYRKGGANQFAGLQLTLPLTPRQGMMPGTLFFTGTPQFSPAIRTQLTNTNQTANLVQPSSVRDLQLDSTLDQSALNGGRASQDYFGSQVHRMRQAFFKFVEK